LLRHPPLATDAWAAGTAAPDGVSYGDTVRRGGRKMVGYGAPSSEEGRGVSVARQAEHLASSIPRIGPRSPALVGHDDFGGMLR
jgi:hypothetical protein